MPEKKGNRSIFVSGTCSAPEINNIVSICITDNNGHVQLRSQSVQRTFKLPTSSSSSSIRMLKARSRRM